VRPKPTYVIYVAVLPVYRRHCVGELGNLFGDTLGFFAGIEHADPTVRSGLDPTAYTEINNHFALNRRLMFQTGEWRQVLGAETAVLDLNPRNLSVWLLTALRRLNGRRTLHWGHLHPRRGSQSKTMWMRTLLRRLSDGTILYGYESVKPALSALPNCPVWVAPNALYLLQDLLAPALPDRGGQTNTDRVEQQAVRRTRITYVGRLVPEKKVMLLVRAFAASAASRDGAILTIVGIGSLEAPLEELATTLSCSDSVRFLGEVNDINRLRHIYAESVCSVSPGYAGLCVTQSLGFGVPILVARNEPHAPEIELAEHGGVTFFESDSTEALSQAIDLAWAERHSVDVETIRARVIGHYSAEAMALGIGRALCNVSSSTENTHGMIS
jgi:glycosyltransferase involved in cell wall biosynthesis